MNRHAGTRLAVLALTLAGLLWVACSGAPEGAATTTTSTPAEPAFASQGRDLYMEHCGSCHGEAGARIPAAPLDVRPYLDQIGDARLVGAASGGAASRHIEIPETTGLPLDEARDVAAYLAAQAGRTSSPLLRFEGQRVYESYCASCHGPHGDRVPAAPLDSMEFVASLDDETLLKTLSTDHGESMGPSRLDELSDIEASVAAAFVRQRTLPGQDDPTIAAGRDLYAGNCLGCHGSAGDSVEDVHLGSKSAEMSVGRIVDLFGGEPPPPHRVGTLDFNQVSDLVGYLTWWAADTDRRLSRSGRSEGTGLETEPPFNVDLKAPIFPDRVVAREYFRRTCAVCHGDDRSGLIGPALLPTTLDGTPEEYARTIAEGRQSRRMPSFGSRLDADQIATMVEFLRSEPASPEDTADRKYGQELFEGTCALCHAVDGFGVKACPLGNPEWIDNMSLDGLITRISRGKPSQGMPTWAEKYGGSLSDEQIASVAQYLRDMAHR